MLVAHQMRQLQETMVKAATKLQSWYRAHLTRVSFRVQILLKLAMIRKRQMEEVEFMLRGVTRIQCLFRVKLAQRRLAEVRAAQGERQEALEDGAGEKEEGEMETVLVDTWHPRSAAAGLQALASPRPDRELEKLEEAGLVPFSSW